MLRPEDCIPGTLVECIDNDGVEELTLKSVYEVEEFIAGAINFVGEENDCIFVRGVSVLDEDGDRYCYPLEIFRPLPDERLSIFRQMLAPKQTERVR